MSLFSDKVRLPIVRSAWRLRPVFSAMLLWVGSTASCQEPAAAHPPAGAWQRLSDKTVFAARIPEMKLARERFVASALGPVLTEPQVRLLIEDVWQSWRATNPAAEQLLGEDPLRILESLAGESCLALTATGEQPLGVVAWCEFRDQPELAARIHERLTARVLSHAGETRSETVRGTPVQIVALEVPAPLPPWLSLSELCLFRRDATIVVANSLATAQDLLEAWDGVVGNEGRLVANPRFERAMASIRQDGEQPAHVVWFADPWALATRSAESDPPTRELLAMLQGLGAKGVVGIGGGIHFDLPDLDSMSRVDLTLDHPREGVLELLALEEVSTAPEPWVPVEVESYTTLRWSLPRTIVAIRQLLSRFLGSEELAESTLRNITQVGGVDLLEEVFPLLTDRFSCVRWLERPIRPESTTTTVGVQVADPVAFQRVLTRMLERHGANVATVPWGAVTIYQWTGPRLRLPLPGPPPQPGFAPPPGRGPPEEPPEGLFPPAGANAPPGDGPFPNGFPERRGDVREPTWCCAILDDQFLISDSLAALKRMIEVSSDPNDRLEQSLSYKLSASKAARLAEGQPICLFHYSAPEEGLRGAYEFLTSPDGLPRLAAAGDDRLLSLVQESLRRHPLPPFEAIAKRLAPAGGIITSNETGLHYVSFSMRRSP